MREKTLSEASSRHEQMLAADPKDGRVLFEHGNIQQRMHRYEDAVHCYRRAMETAVEKKDVLNNLGNALLELNRHEDALDSYNRALELFSR